jgi:hypothetical protein
MDLAAVSQAVAVLVASGAGKELAEDAGRGMIAAVVDRVRQLFGHDRRLSEALEQARDEGSAVAVADLAAALRWYGERDAGFAAELAGWAAQSGSAGPVVQHAAAFGHAQQAVQGHGVQNVTFGGQHEPGSGRG